MEIRTGDRVYVPAEGNDWPLGPGTVVDDSPSFADGKSYVKVELDKPAQRHSSDSPPRTGWFCRKSSLMKTTEAEDAKKPRSTRDEIVLEIVSRAHFQSVALTEVMLNRRWKYLNEEGRIRYYDQEEGAPPYAFNNRIDILGVTKQEVQSALENDPQKYFTWEGSAECGSGLYDFQITPRHIFDQRGINTELESWIRVEIAEEAEMSEAA